MPSSALANGIGFLISSKLSRFYTLLLYIYTVLLLDMEPGAKIDTVCPWRDEKEKQIKRNLTAGHANASLNSILVDTIQTARTQRIEGNFINNKQTNKNDTGIMTKHGRIVSIRNEIRLCCFYRYVYCSIKEESSSLFILFYYLLAAQKIRVLLVSPPPFWVIDFEFTCWCCLTAQQSQRVW